MGRQDKTRQDDSDDDNDDSDDDEDNDLDEALPRKILTGLEGSMGMASLVCTILG